MIRAKNLTDIVCMCWETKIWEWISLLPVSCTSPLKNNGYCFKISSIISVPLFFALLRIFICVLSQLFNICFRIAFKRLLWYEEEELWSAWVSVLLLNGTLKRLNSLLHCKVTWSIYWYLLKYLWYLFHFNLLMFDRKPTILVSISI